MEMKRVLMIIAFAVLVLSGMYAQSVSVSPSRLYYKEMPGGYKSQKIYVTNNGKKPETFQVLFHDFKSEGNRGKTQVVKEGEYEHGCSKWLTASPAFFEVAPGQTQTVEILLQVPNIPEANNSRWAVASIKLSKENTGMQDKGSNVTGMQIIQTFQFLIHIFQSPPTVTFKQADVISFKDVSEPGAEEKTLTMEVENSGDAILDCAPYLDVVNLNTGESRRIKGKGFTILPGGKRAVKFTLPKGLSKGKYNILGVVDYGSDADLAGAELNIEI
jgi:P pilus assembly chaperone PapD